MIHSTNREWDAVCGQIFLQQIQISDRSTDNLLSLALLQRICKVLARGYFTNRCGFVNDVLHIRERKKCGFVNDVLHIRERKKNVFG